MCLIFLRRLKDWLHARLTFWEDIQQRNDDSSYPIAYFSKRRSPSEKYELFLSFAALKFTLDEFNDQVRATVFLKLQRGRIYSGCWYKRLYYSPTLVHHSVSQASTHRYVSDPCPYSRSVARSLNHHVRGKPPHDTLIIFLSLDDISQMFVKSYLVLELI